MVSISLTVTTKAQIPNNGFENWITVGNCIEPTDWNSSNTFDSLGSYFPITRSTDHYPATVGSYSIRIENNVSLLPTSPAFGVAWSGNFDDPGKPSFPITGHPTSFCGYYKFFPQNNDTVFINLVLFNNGIPLDSVRLSNTLTVSNWTSFNIPIPSYASADSGKITLASYFGNNQYCIPHGNSVLYVDNLSFDNLISSVTDQTSKNITFSLYPNPASAIVTLNTNNVNIEDLEINIYNVMGDIVQSESLKQNNRQINIGDLNNGIYIVTLKSKDLIENQRLIIQR